MRVFTRQELPDPVGRWQNASEIQAYPTQEFAVARVLGRLDTEPAQFVEHVLVDEVNRLNRAGKRHRRADHAHRRAGNLSSCAHQYRGLAELARLYLPRLIHLGYV